MSNMVNPILGSKEEKRAFYKNALWIMLPIALQNLMDTAVNSADVIMLSYVSQDALSASSLAGQVYFIMSNLIYGLSSASSIMAAQYWGKGDCRTVERVLGVALRIALMVSIPFALAAAICPAISGSAEKARFPMTGLWGLVFTSATGAKSRLKP